MTKRERPVLFSGAMVRAILEGRKTQTRRIIQSPAKNMQRSGMQVIKHRASGDPWYGAHVWSMRDRMGVWGDYTDEEFHSLCPYGAAGTRLWVRETWAVGRVFDRTRPSEIPTVERDIPVWWQADGAAEESVNRGRWRPSLYMPRWASRINLEVTSVRVERLHEITGPGILAEGAVERAHEHRHLGRCPVSAFDGRMYVDLMSLWRAGWDSINGKRPGCSWADNPWVWAVSFRRLEAER